jgi:transposase
MHAVVHPTDIQDCDGGILVLASMFGLYPFLEKLFADGGYQGPQFRAALAKELPRLSVEIVKRSDSAKGFKVLPRCWGVERTFAWLNRCRRLAQDFENLNRNALAFIRLASDQADAEKTEQFQMIAFGRTLRPVPSILTLHAKHPCCHLCFRPPSTVPVF